MSPATRSFMPRDTVRNISTDTVRQIQQVNEADGGNMLLVRADEARDNSPLWTWRAANCELVNAAPDIVFNVHDKVTLGSGTVVREIKDTRIHHHSGEMQYRVDVDGEKEKWVYALALHPVVESVADKMKATDELPTAEIPDDIPAPDSTSRDLLMRAAKEVGEAHEKTAAAEARAEVAEKNNKKLLEQIQRLESVVTKPIAAPSTCVEYKTLQQQLHDGVAAADREMSDTENDGWELVNITVFGAYSQDGGEGGTYTRRVVTFKRTVTATPAPTRGTAGHHAALTNPFISPAEYSARQQPIEPDAILQPVNQRKMGPLETSVRANGAEATAQALNGVAFSDMMQRARERTDAMLIGLRPLHSLKASN